MSVELTALTLAALLQMAQFGLYAIAGNLQLGMRMALSPRDDQVELTGRAGRLHRAMNNHFEGLILFTIAVLVVTLGAQSTPTTQTAAWIYLGARLLYVPAYVFGWVPWRSLIWGSGFGATLTMLVAAMI